MSSSFLNILHRYITTHYNAIFTFFFTTELVTLKIQRESRREKPMCLCIEQRDVVSLKRFLHLEFFKSKKNLRRKWKLCEYCINCICIYLFTILVPLVSISVLRSNRRGLCCLSPFPSCSDNGRAGLTLIMDWTGAAILPLQHDHII